MKNFFSKQVKTPALVALGLLPFTSLLSLSDNGHAQIPTPKAEYLVADVSQTRQWNDFSARISPRESVNIKPLVGGRIESVLFREGEEVEQGQPLFVIDPRPFEAAVKKAEAALATAKARVRLTSQELKRSRDLIKSELISQSVFDAALTEDQTTKASVLQAESSLFQAQLNLEYAHIKAPISGRIGRAELTLGNIVESGPTAPVLTTIVSQDTVYAEFNVDERTFIALKPDPKNTSPMPVHLILGSDPAVSYEGFLHAFDNHLDLNSGTIRARAIFDNEDNRLTPGMYVDVRLGSANTTNTVLIPERAIGTNQDRKYIYIIDDNSTAQYREVTLGQQQKGLRAIRSGIEVGERIIVNGLARIRPNAPVEPVQSSTTDDIASITH